MRILWILVIFTAMIYSSIAATTWPAGTNVANTFFQTNRFLKNVTFGTPATNIISDGGSKINGVGLTNSTVTGNISSTSVTIDAASPGNFPLFAEVPTVFDVNASYMIVWPDNRVSRTLDGSLFTNIQGSSIVGTITVSQLNVGTLILTNPPSLDLSSSTNFNASGLFYKTNVSTAAPNFFLPYSLFVTNAAFAFLAPLNVSATNAQTAVVMVTNSTGSSVVVTAPANVHTQGTWNVTNVSTFTFFNYGGVFTNAIAFPLF